MKPNIYFFNPTCELAVANGSASYMAPVHLRKFENELCTLAGILARPNDIVLVDQLPNQQFTDQLAGAGFHQPAYRNRDAVLSDSKFLSDTRGFLFPWGWSPAAHKLLWPLKTGCCIEFLSSPVAEWQDIHRELYSRKSSLAILSIIVDSNISNNMITYNDFPEICTSHDQIISLQRKWGKVVVKAPWSSSGRGLQVLRNDEYNQTNRQVINGYFKQQKFVVAEPWYDKVLDLSFQFYSYGNGTIEYKGLTSFSTDQAGHYTGNYIHELPVDLRPELKEYLEGTIPELRKILHQLLMSSDYSKAYYGWIGVDTLVWKSSDGKYKFHPCLEINCRFTMGAVALSLREHLAEDATGEFRIFHGKEGEFQQFCDEKLKKEPLICDNGKMMEGFLPLSPAEKDGNFGAWISISKNERMKK